MSTSNHTTAHRTNSLAFAKSPCHTCTTLKEHCDRRRPRCETCISHNRPCGGFVQELVWKDPSRPSFRLGTVQPGSYRNSRTPVQTSFKFVQGRAKRKRKTKLAHPDMATLTTTLDLQSAKTRHVRNTVLGQKSTEKSVGSYDDYVDSAAPTSPRSTPPLALPPLLHSLGDLDWAELESHTTESTYPRPESISPNLDYAASDLNLNWSYLSGHATLGLAPTQDIETMAPFDNVEDDHHSRHQSYPSKEQVHLLPGVLYEDLTQKYGSVLTMYDEEFCVLPLSRDCRTNPFRVHMHNINASPFLLHAILAVSSQHLAKKKNEPGLAVEMLNHRSTALHLFSEALGQSDAIPLLDTIIVLVHLEITQTALSTWGVHLNGARNLLARSGALEKHRGDSRLYAQIAMIVWWDITIAFVSRTAPRLPMDYLEMLVDLEKSDDWSFFVLNGCPIEFVMAMAKLAKLSVIYKQTTKMEWTIFDTTPVDLIVEQIKEYSNEYDVSIDDIGQQEDNANALRNHFHCVEAWRHAILLYARRVFFAEHDTSSLRTIDHLARLIIDSVRCIPSSEVLQKQLLLPVFLAGAEVSGEDTRYFVRDYCKHWSDTSRFYHFESAATLLGEIWKDNNFPHRDVYWWGVKVDFETQADPDETLHSTASELLFG